MSAGKFAVDFMDAVKKLPATVDRFDKTLVDIAVTAYNALMAHPEELNFVSESYFTTFESARSAYNVDYVINKIAHLYDMDKLEYCFNNVKEAKNAYDALSATDKALITNASVLDEKIAALNAIYGKEVDFNLSYKDNVGVEEEETPVDPGENNEPDKGMKPWAIVLIVVGSVLVLAGGAAVTVILIKKKRATGVTE